MITTSQKIIKKPASRESSLLREKQYAINRYFFSKNLDVSDFLHNFAKEKNK